ncbi:MAG TPA: hypothetical protein VGR45_06465, partial [Stellaceae bacterium]|nr:hypothetical protein [Stellaceae bacterium]
LADGGANTLTLTNANFAGIGSAAITVYDGDGGNTVNGSSLSSPDAIVAYAGAGLDKLTGGAGNDVFFAGGSTTMTGKTGTNEFAFFGPGAANVIADFAASATNEIAFSNFGFSLGLPGASAAPKALPTTLFVANSSGSFTNAVQRFAYNTTSGQMMFDADGNGSGSAPQLVSTLTNHPTVTASQLFFVT